MNFRTQDPFKLDDREIQSDSGNGNIIFEGISYTTPGNDEPIKLQVEPLNIDKSEVIRWLSQPKNANETLHITLSESFPCKRVFSTVMVLKTTPENSNIYSVVYFEIINQLLQPSGVNEFNDFFGKLVFTDKLPI